MKTTMLASFAIAGFLATSTAQAGTNPTAEEIYSGLSSAAIQQVHKASEQQSARKATCKWREADEDKDLLYAAYPGDNFTEKDYLAPSNFNFVC